MEKITLFNFTLFNSTVLAALIPEHGWSWNIPLVILVATVVATPLTRLLITEPGRGPNLVPLPLPAGLKWPELFAAVSIGHILGISTVLFLRYTDYF